MQFPWKYIVVSVLIGLVIGGAAGLYCSPRIEGHWTKKSGEMFLKHLDHEVHLSEAQREQVNTFITTNREKVTSYQDQIRKEVRAQIRAILSPDQQVGFDAMVARHDAERKKQEGQ
jgi:hypothetical protein